MNFDLTECPSLLYFLTLIIIPLVCIAVFPEDYILSEGKDFTLLLFFVGNTLV